jgi:small subunit ribosomal protein S17
MRKVRTGSVVRTKQDKTAIVEMVWKQRNRLYRKQVRRIARFYVHDPENQCRLGDVVRIEETRPISKTKHWRLMEILERRQVAEIRPIELESDVEPVFSPPEPVDEAELDDDTATDEGEDADEAEEEPEDPSEEPEAEESEEPVEEIEDEEDSLEEDNGEEKE